MRSRPLCRRYEVRYFFVILYHPGRSYPAFIRRASAKNCRLWEIFTRLC